MTTWPKHLPALTDEQQEIADDFVEYWHDQLPRFGLIERFNHGYPVRRASRTFSRTLEVGAGLGEHLRHERLTAEQRRGYVALELRENVAARLRAAHPDVEVLVGDCQERLPFADEHFDRVVAVHVLEHLPNLPAALKELHRVCRQRTGVLSVVIPCEGGLAYGLVRRMSAKRMFEARYHQPYDWFISREHLNRPNEVLDELRPLFRTAHRRFFPLRIPTTAVNLCIGLTLHPRRKAPQG